MKMADFWPNAYAAVILVSFLVALAGNEEAMKLWLEGWEGMAVLLAGSGMRMAKDVALRRAAAKGGSISVGEGEPP